MGSRFVYCSIHILHAPADSRGVLVRPVRVMGIRSLVGQHGFSPANHHLALAAASWYCCAALVSLTTGIRICSCVLAIAPRLRFVPISIGLHSYCLWKDAGGLRLVTGWPLLALC